MELLSILAIGIFAYLLFFRRTSRVIGPKSQWIFINATEAPLCYNKFLKLVGMGLGMDEKEYKEWTKNEKKIWDEWGKKFRNKMQLKIQYLASEDSYLILPSDGEIEFVARDGRNTLLYSNVIAGQDSTDEPYIELEVHERIIKQETFLTACLTYTNYNRYSNIEKDIKILCDFPIFSTKSNEEFKEMGFKVSERGGDDIYEDAFGEKQLIPHIMTCRKNGVVFTRKI